MGHGRKRHSGEDVEWGHREHEDMGDRGTRTQGMGTQGDKGRAMKTQVTVAQGLGEQGHKGTGARGHR